MANIKWIGTQELGKDMEPLLKLARDFSRKVIAAKE